MSKIRVINKEGKTGSIPLEDWSDASKRGYSLFEPEATITDRVKEFGQGMASNIGGLADVANKYVGAPVAHAAGYGADLASYSAKNMGLEKVSQGIDDIAKSAHGLGHQYTNSNMESQLPNSEVLKTNNVPDKTSAVLKSAGNTMVDILPFFAAGKGLQLLNSTGKIINQPWVHSLNKILATDLNLGTAAGFAGSGAGAELAKSDDPNVSVAEDVTRQILGAVAGAGIGNAALPAVKGIWKTLIHPIETSKSASTSILATATGGKINKEALEAGKRLGLHLPPSLATDSKLAKGIENTVLKSWFTSKAYHEVIEKIPQTMIKEIDKNLDEIGTKIASSTSETASQIASGEYKAALESQAKIWKEQSDTLFENAVGFLTEADTMAVPKTLETVRSMKSNLEKGITAPEGAQKTVLDKLIELEQNLAKGNVRVDDLVAEQQKLLKLGKYGEVKGYENYYNGVADMLTDELLTYKINKSFADNYKPARAFYRENIINRIRTDTARSILQGQLPKEAFSYMTTPRNIKQLEHILGDTPNAKEIMGTLKRAKISQVLIDSNIINSASEFNAGAFARTFGRESKEPLLKALMGENYSKVQDNILPIANAITSSGKVLANPSGTANTLKDTSLVVGAVTGIATGSVSTGGASLAGMGLINLISRAFASPKYLEKLIAKSNMLEAKAQAKQNNKGAVTSLLDRTKGLLAKPYTTDAVLKALSGKKGLDFNRDKFLDDVRDSTDRDSFMYTPAEIKEMRKRK